MRLGHGNEQHHVRAPKLVDALKGKKVIQVSTGALHTLCLANGQVWGFGDNDFYQQGNGTTQANKVATLIQGFDHYPSIAGVACGSSHSCVWASLDCPCEYLQFTPISFAREQDPLGIYCFHSFHLKFAELSFLSLILCIKWHELRSSRQGVFGPLWLW